MPAKTLLTFIAIVPFIAAYYYLVWCVMKGRIHIGVLLHFASFRVYSRKEDPLKFWGLWVLYCGLLTFIFAGFIYHTVSQWHQPVEKFLAG
jgi:hypothetical protein